MPDVPNFLADRKHTHGPFEEFSHICQELKAIVYNSPDYAALSDVQKEVLDMTCHKLARILTGDPNHIDHWEDIAGYNVRAVEFLRSKQCNAIKI
jgi:hypothetical protein